MSNLRVLVVDDTIVYRKVLSVAAEGTGLVEYIQTASNAQLALERLEQAEYDVVLLDVVMPGMTGLELLGVLRRRYKDTAVIMITSEGGESAKHTIAALEQGALDFILKPHEADPDKNIAKLVGILRPLFAQIAIKNHSKSAPAKRVPLTEVEVPTVAVSARRTTPVVPRPRRELSGIDLLVVASSTGGPMALKAFFAGLSRDFPAPIVVVQHMPQGFTDSLAASLSRETGITVKEAADGLPLIRGQAILARGGSHLTIERLGGGTERVAKILDAPAVGGLRPCADLTFSSIAEVYKGQRVVAVVLTGMGTDSVKGVKALKESCDCYTITQSEATSVVYGMPRAVFEGGLSDEQHDLDQIPERLNSMARSRR